MDYDKVIFDKLDRMEEYVSYSISKHDAEIVKKYWNIINTDTVGYSFNDDGSKIKKHTVYGYKSKKE